MQLRRYSPMFASSVLAMVLSLFCTPLRAQLYNFTKIADTSGVFSSLTFNTFGPSLSPNGIVGFEAMLTSGGQGLYSGNGTTITTLTDTNTTGFSRFYSPPVINVSGDYAFCASSNSGGLGYYKSSGGNLLTLQALTSGISYAGMPSINDGGSVAFTNGAPDGSGNSEVYRGDGKTLTVIAQVNSTFVQFGNAVINAGDKVAVHVIESGNGHGVITGDGSSISILYDTSGQFSSFSNVDINSLDQVAFRARLTAGGQGIYTGDGGSPTAVATTGSIFSSFGSAPAINDSGEVAFIGNLQQGGSGLYVGPNPVADKVIATGDTLDGKTISSLEFWNNGLNNAGQLAFTAFFTDNSSAIFRADLMPASVPEPSASMAAISLLCVTALLWRKRRVGGLHYQVCQLFNLE